MKILCALNPLSGDGLALQRWPQIASIMSSFGVAYDLLADKETPLGNQVTHALDREMPGGYKAILGIGGDGTHSSIVNTLMKYRKMNPGKELPPYALIPMGTGNDIAKSLGLDTRENFFFNDLHRAVATAIYGADYMMDLGVVGGTHFLDALTIGLDSRVLREHNRRKMKIRHFPMLRRMLKGYALYMLCVGARMWRHRRLIADITVDGRPWYSGPVINLIINNTRVYGGEFVFCTNAYANDGLLDVAVFTDRRDYLMKYVLALRRNPRQVKKMGERLNAISCHAQGQHVQIRLSHPEAAQVDGEVINAGSAFDISIVPSAIKLKTPVEPEV